MQPGSPKQLEFWRNAHHRWNIKTGATRSGKTYLDYFLIPKRLVSGDGKDGLNVILGNTRETIRRNILLPMQEMYGVRRVGNIRSDNSCMMFGQRVFVLGADNANHVDRLRGSSIKYCYGDEVVTWHPDVFDMLKSRLDKPYSVFDGTCNPDSPQHWFYEFLQSDADIYQQSYTIDDNPYLDPSFVANLKREYEGTVLYDRYINGLWVAAEGALFTTYPKYTDDETLFRDGIAHIDAAYGGEDFTALTIGKRQGDTLYLYGRLWHKHVDTVLETCIEEAKRLLCAPILCETNADKGYLAKEIQRRGYSARPYPEHMNKHLKISTFLRKWWGNVVFLTGTDKAYQAQILSYTEDAEHDDACLAGDTLIATLTGDKLIKDIKTGEYVITPAGIRKVLFAGVTGYKAVQNYHGLFATPDHKIFDKCNGTFSRADRLTCAASYDIISLKELIIWKTRLLCSMAKPMSEIQRADITSSAQQEIANAKMRGSCTEPSGNITTGKSRQGITYTTLMVMSIITTLATWSVYKLGNTCRAMQRKILKIANIGDAIENSCLHSKKKQKNGTGAKPGQNGTGNTHKNLLPKQTSTALKNNVNSVAKRILGLRNNVSALKVAVKKQDGAGLDLNSNLVKGSAKTVGDCSPHTMSDTNFVVSDVNSSIIPVYNLTVENAGCYYANGILVSNCDSAACVARHYDRRGGGEYKSPFEP